MSKIYTFAWGGDFSVKFTPGIVEISYHVNGHKRIVSILSTSESWEREIIPLSGPNLPLIIEMRCNGAMTNIKLSYPEPEGTSHLEIQAAEGHELKVAKSLPVRPGAQDPADGKIIALDVFEKNLTQDDRAAIYLAEPESLETWMTRRLREIGPVTGQHEADIRDDLRMEFHNKSPFEYSQWNTNLEQWTFELEGNRVAPDEAEKGIGEWVELMQLEGANSIAFPK